jgi:hypothetical protein
LKLTMIMKHVKQVEFLDFWILLGILVSSNILDIY